MRREGRALLTFILVDVEIFANIAETLLVLLLFERASGFVVE